ncbi:GntR family transcriptional regulator [Arthrobacter monumenti]
MSVGTDGSPGELGWLVVDESSAIPPYEQIRRQIAEAVHNGSLVVGTKLPSVRALASRLGLAVNTVARSYRELEQAQLVETRSRAGTVIAAGTDQDRLRLAQAAAVYADVVRSQGASPAEAVALLNAAMDAANFRLE